MALAYLMVVRGRALAALGRREEARGSLAEAVTTAAELHVARPCGEAMGSPWVGAVADHVAGLLADAQGDRARAEDLHHAAPAVHVERGYAFDVVDTLGARLGR